MVKKMMKKKRATQTAKPFRYKKEGPEARAWLRVAKNVERNHGGFGYNADGYVGVYGLCCAVNSQKNVTLLNSMHDRMLQFVNVNHADSFWWDLPHWRRPDGTQHGRTLAAWLCYWQCREEGV